MLRTELDEDSILMYCALRFNGEAYITMRVQNAQWGFEKITEDIETSMIFPEDDLECLAAFYAMQRYLGKWGGEYLTEVSREHIVYRLLFLHCYRMEIPLRLRTSDWYETWETRYRPKREECAALIRNTMGRRIVGPEAILDPGLFKEPEDEHPAHYPE